MLVRPTSYFRVALGVVTLVCGAVITYGEATDPNGSLVRILISVASIVGLAIWMMSGTFSHRSTDDNAPPPDLLTDALIGLILLALSQTHDSVTPSNESQRLAPLPTQIVTANERQSLTLAAEELKKLEADSFYTASYQERAAIVSRIEELLDDVVGLYSAKIEGSTRYGSIQARLAGYRTDRQADAALKRVEALRKDGTRTLARAENAGAEGKPNEVKAAVHKLRDDVILLSTSGELPARNAGNLGLLLYSEHLLSIELAGTLLLVATIGAIAIAHRKAVTT